MERRRLLWWLGSAAVAAAAAPLVLSRDREPALDVEPAPSPPGGAGTSPEPSPAPATGDPTDARSAPRPELDDRTAAPTSPAAGEADQAAAVTLAVLCRDAWGARPPTGPGRPHELRRLTVHHTAVPHAAAREGPARARQHQRHHQDSGFVDLAYHYLIDRGGNVYEGRDLATAGETFTDYDPAGHFLPCLEGDFGRQQPSDAQLTALARLLAWAVADLGLPLDTLAGHRAYAATGCPGDAVQRLLDDGSLHRRVEHELAGGVALRSLCGDEGRQRVAAIEAGAA